MLLNCGVGEDSWEPVGLQGDPISSGQSLHCVWLFVTPWTAARQASLPITKTQSMFKLMSIEPVMPPNHLIPCPPLLLPSSFPASGSFQMSQFFATGGQIIGVSAPTSVLSMNIQDWSPLGCTGWISLQSKGLSRVYSSTTVQKHQFFVLSLHYGPTLTSVHEYWKNHSFDCRDLCQQNGVSAFYYTV